MKLSDVKERIDAYFDSVSPGEIIRRFETLGFEFEPRFDTYTQVTINREPDISLTEEGRSTLIYPNIAIDLTMFDNLSSDDANGLFEVPAKTGNATAAGTPSYAMAA